MTPMYAVLALGFIFFVTEILFFMYCFRWLASGRHTREKEFARLDLERMALLRLQQEVRQEIEEARSLGEEAVQKLRMLGSEAHAEWTEMRQQLERVAAELQENTMEVMGDHLGNLTRQRLAVEKTLKDSRERELRMIDILKSTQKVIRFFDQKIPVDQIIKDLQTEKYAEAGKLLEEGCDPAIICKKLGISLSELTLLSHMR